VAFLTPWYKKKTTRNTFKWLEVDNNIKYCVLILYIHTLQPGLGVFCPYRQLDAGLSRPTDGTPTGNLIISKKYLNATDFYAKKHRPDVTHKIFSILRDPTRAVFNINQTIV
jgi:hypothetical protein